MTDSLNRTAYAVQPYLNGSGDESQWDLDFGIASETLPVWADEWSANTGQSLGFYNPSTTPPDNFQPAVDFLKYIRAHSIAFCSGA